MSYTTCTEDIKLIERTVSSLANTERSIAQGSDEHLDMILNIQRGFSNVVQFISTLVNAVEKNFNLYTIEQAKEMLAKIHEIFHAAESLKDSIAKTSLQGQINSQLEVFCNELNDLREIANDLSRYRVNMDQDYNSLFND